MDSSQKNIFINIIKDISIEAGCNCNILPSVIGALAIIESNFGTDNDCALTNNLFKERVDDNWFGKCYSIDTQIVYDTPSDSKEDRLLLIKVFNNMKDSISQWATYLSTIRRSPNGPLKYQSIFGDISYVSVINKLNRAGYFIDHTKLEYDDVIYMSEIFNIIENNELYLWDDKFKENAEMSKKKTFKRSNFVTEETESALFDNPAHMYRVRLSWDKHDSQIFASPSYEDAKSEALKHEGYKIYIDDDGELFEDPWLEIQANREEELKRAQRRKVDGVTEVIIPQRGKPIDLNNTPVYASASINVPFITLSGRYYYYDHTIIYGRAKISKVPNPVSIKDIYGYIILP